MHDSIIERFRELDFNSKNYSLSRSNISCKSLTDFLKESNIYRMLSPLRLLEDPMKIVEML